MPGKMLRLQLHDSPRFGDKARETHARKTSGLAVPVVLVAIVELAALVVLVVRVVN